MVVKDPLYIEEEDPLYDAVVDPLDKVVLTVPEEIF